MSAFTAQTYAALDFASSTGEEAQAHDVLNANANVDDPGAVPGAASTNLHDAPPVTEGGATGGEVNAEGAPSPPFSTTAVGMPSPMKQPTLRKAPPSSKDGETDVERWVKRTKAAEGGSVPERGRAWTRSKDPVARPARGSNPPPPNSLDRLAWPTPADANPPARRIAEPRRLNKGQGLGAGRQREVAGEGGATAPASVHPNAERVRFPLSAGAARWTSVAARPFRAPGPQRGNVLDGPPYTQAAAGSDDDIQYISEYPSQPRQPERGADDEEDVDEDWIDDPHAGASPPSEHPDSAGEADYAVRNRDKGKGRACETSSVTLPREQTGVFQPWDDTAMSLDERPARPVGAVEQDGRLTPSTLPWLVDDVNVLGATDEGAAENALTDLQKQKAARVAPEFRHTRTPITASPILREPTDGMRAGERLENVESHDKLDWDEYVKSEYCFCMYVVDVDGDSNIAAMNQTLLAIELEGAIRKTEPGSQARVSQAKGEHNGPPVRPGLFLVRVDSQRTQENWHDRPFVRFDKYSVGTFPYHHDHSYWLGTWHETRMGRQDMEERFRTQCRGSARVQQTFSRIEDNYPGQGQRAWSRFISSVEARELVTIPRGARATGTTTVEFNMYVSPVRYIADGEEVGLTLDEHTDLMKAVGAIRVPHSLLGAAVKRAKYLCLICHSRSHPTGMCPSKDVEGWGKPFTPRPSRARPAPATTSKNNNQPAPRGGNSSKRGRAGKNNAD